MRALVSQIFYLSYSISKVSSHLYAPCPSCCHRKAASKTCFQTPILQKVQALGHGVNNSEQNSAPIRQNSTRCAAESTILLRTCLRDLRRYERILKAAPISGRVLIVRFNPPTLTRCRRFIRLRSPWFISPG